MGRLMRSLGKILVWNRGDGDMRSVGMEGEIKGDYKEGLFSFKGGFTIVEDDGDELDLNLKGMNAPSWRASKGAYRSRLILHNTEHLVPMENSRILLHTWTISGLVRLCI